MEMPDAVVTNLVAFISEADDYIEICDKNHIQMEIPEYCFDIFNIAKSKIETLQNAAK